MFIDVPGQWYARNVLIIVCNRPRDGSPAAALESQLLIAFGLPPDSVCIWNSTRPASIGDRPSIDSARITSPRHCSTPAPTEYLMLPIAEPTRDLAPDSRWCIMLTPRS